MKSKGQIKLSEKERNQLNLICGSPCDRTTRKVFGRICKRKQSQASEICICIPYIYMHYSCTTYKNRTSLGWKDIVPVKNQYYQL